MRKLFLVLLTHLLFLSLQIFGQISSNKTVDSLFNTRGEICFSFSINSPGEIAVFTNVVSIDNVKGNTVIAYASKKEFAEFLLYGKEFHIVPSPGTAVKPEDVANRDVRYGDEPFTLWNFYPTYDQYVDFMTGFANQHPSLCKLDTIGTSVQGRLLLAVKISDNVGDTEAEPQFLYTSSIHGDETTGYVLMLHLIEYLLTGYGTDPYITELVNSTEIFINPLANPDGTYKGGNNSVYGAIRYNANFVDLNRNYPDPKMGPHPDGNEWQKETIAFMDYAEANHFSISANFHGGAEVFNYPWDTWSKLTADDDWWQFVGREWADTVHVYGPPGYFDDLDNGITNGYAWYELNGGRQDYMNYWHNCREVTLEISNIKLLPANQLLNFWNYNYRSFLNYIRQANYGFNGIVTDTVTDEPVEAKVYIFGHDRDFSEVYSHQPTGFYARPIYAGTYNVIFSAPGYYSKTIKDVEVENRSTTRLDVQLRPLTYDAQDKATRFAMIYPNPSNGKFKLMMPERPVNPSCAIQVLNSVGNLVYSTQLDCAKGCTSVDVSLPPVPAGLYFLKFNSGHRIYLDKLIIRH